MKAWPARLVLVGAGKMGGAMARGWLQGGLDASSLSLVEPNLSPEIEALAALGVAINPICAEPPDVLVLAIKPQSVDAVAPQIAPFSDESTLVLSILAGKTIGNLKARLPWARAVVRAMPNTPAAIGRGVTAAFASPEATAEHRRWCEALLGAIGAFYWVEEEFCDRCGDSDIGRRTRLRVRPDGSARGGRGKARLEHGTRDESCARHCRGSRRIDAARKRNGARRSAPCRHLAGWHDGGSACGASGRGRPRGSDGSGGGGCVRPGGRNGGMKRAVRRLLAPKAHGARLTGDLGEFSLRPATLGGGR